MPAYAIMPVGASFSSHLIIRVKSGMSPNPLEITFVVRCSILVALAVFAPTSRSSLWVSRFTRFTPQVLSLDGSPPSRTWTNLDTHGTNLDTHGKTHGKN